MRLVLPEVVVLRAELLHVRNARFGIEHFEDALSRRLEFRRLGILLHGFRVARVHPLERLLAMNVLEPEIGVFGGGFAVHGSRSGCGGFLLNRRTGSRSEDEYANRSGAQEMRQVHGKFCPGIERLLSQSLRALSRCGSRAGKKSPARGGASGLASRGCGFAKTRT